MFVWLEWVAPDVAILISLHCLGSIAQLPPIHLLHLRTVVWYSMHDPLQQSHTGACFSPPENTQKRM